MPIGSFKLSSLLVAGFLLMILTGCITSPQVSRSSETPTKSIAGIVVDYSDRTITIEDQQNQHRFTIRQGLSSSFALGDRLQVYYREDAPEVALELQLLQQAPKGAQEQIYDVLGTAGAITGDKWEKMLAHRQQLTQMAKDHSDCVHINMYPKQKIVYLTFDDGPDPIYTQAVMDTLLKYGVGGSFFVTGQNIQKNPSIVKELYDKGFTIGLHGYDHSSLATQSPKEIALQLKQTNDLVIKHTGHSATSMRPPYGALNEEAIQAIKAQQYAIYLWSLDTLDWAQEDKGEILRNITENLRPGEIILMHASYDQALASEVLPEVIEYIQAQGYKLEALPR